MNTLSDLEQSISQLTEDEFVKFRKWFWEFENQKWDAQIKLDISENKLESIANEAMAEYNKGEFKTL